MNTENPICKLCREKEANQTGSHIFTHALISACVNLVGEKARDMEMMFGIYQEGKTDLFVGRDVSSDRIEEVKGRPLSDEEIIFNRNALIRDNEFCLDCERLFGKVESGFSSSIKKIRKNKIRTLDTTHEIRLYFIIQAWRASACNYNGWKLKPDFEEYLRGIICNS